MRVFRPFVLTLAALALASCKISILVPEGGSVESDSGAYTCLAGETCNIDVVDIFFDENFNAVPEEGVVFVSWRQRDKGLCGGNTGPCGLFTTAFAGNDALMAVLESDEIFYLEPVFASDGAANEDFPNNLASGSVLNAPEGAVFYIAPELGSGEASALYCPILPEGEWGEEGCKVFPEGMTANDFAAAVSFEVLVFVDANGDGLFDAGEDSGCGFAGPMAYGEWRGALDCAATPAPPDTFESNLVINDADGDGASGFRVEWALAVTEVEYYALYRSTQEGVLGVSVYQGLGNAYDDAALTDGVTYSYTVQACTDGGCVSGEQVSRTYNQAF